MRGRHLQTLIALALAGLWGLGVYFAHLQGNLRFLDRVESTMTDLRTLARGVRVPPDSVIIVAIDDAVVKQGGSYPVARADLAPASHRRRAGRGAFAPDFPHGNAAAMDDRRFALSVAASGVIGYLHKTPFNEQHVE
jgi:hypothetical protein